MVLPPNQNPGQERLNQDLEIFLLFSNSTGWQQQPLSRSTSESILEMDQKQIKNINNFDSQPKSHELSQRVVINYSSFSPFNLYLFSSIPVIFCNFYYSYTPLLPECPHQPYTGNKFGTETFLVCPSHSVSVSALSVQKPLHQIEVQPTIRVSILQRQVYFQQSVSL